MFTQIGRKSAALLLLALLVLALVPVAAAFEGQDADGGYRLAAGEVINDDLYVAGDTVIIDGTVNGDLFASASRLEINGTVSGDVMAAANEIVINGRIGDDARIGAAAVTINGQIDGDMLAAAYGIVLAPQSVIAGDVLAGGYSVIAAGSIGRDLWLGAQNARLDGSVGRAARLEVGSAEGAPPFDPMLFNPQMPEIETARDGLTFGPAAAIGGDLSYSAADQLSLAPGLVGGQTLFEQVVVDSGETVPQEQRLLRDVWGAAQRWLLTLLVGGLLLRFAGAWLARHVATIDSALVATTAYGLLWYFGWMLLLLVGLFAVIALAILLGVLQLPALAGAVIGTGLFGLGTALGAYILVLLFVTKVLVGLWLGGRLLPRSENRLLQLALGALIIHLLVIVPFVGPLVNLLTAVCGLGALWLTWRGRALPAEKQPLDVATA